MYKPKAFMSYAHVDDEDGSLTSLRTLLTREVRVFYGREFEIFQDRADIEFGQNWKERIGDTLNEVMFIMPIITPTFLNSSYCRNEVQQFLDHEQERGRNDLVLPLYYVEDTLWDDDQEWQNDEIVKRLREHQFVDWRELRGRPPDSYEFRKELAKLAGRIRNALRRMQDPGKLDEDALRPPTLEPSPKLRSIAGGQDPTVRRQREQQLASVDIDVIDRWIVGIGEYNMEASAMADAGHYETAVGIYDRAVSKSLAVLVSLKLGMSRSRNSGNQDSSSA